MVGRPSFPFFSGAMLVSGVSNGVYCSSLSPFPFISFGAATQMLQKELPLCRWGAQLLVIKGPGEAFCWCEGRVPYHQATLESMVDGWSSCVFLPVLLVGYFDDLFPGGGIRSNPDSARFRYVSRSHLKRVDPWCTNKVDWYRMSENRFIMFLVGGSNVFFNDSF